MSPRELRLRQRLDVLTDEREEARAQIARLTRRLVAQRERRLFRHCPYCGMPCRGPACTAHLDLHELEASVVGNAQG